MILFEQIKKDMEALLPHKRYLHISAVTQEADRLADVFQIENKNDLVISALLHDCTKPLTYDEHLKLAQKYSIKLSQDDINSPQVLHARTGAFEAKEKYGVSSEAFDAIFCHTTGKENMTVFEKILFLSDYIEVTRTYEACRLARTKFYSELEMCKTYGDKLKALDRAVLSELTFTLNYLRQNGLFIHSDTYHAIDFLKSEEHNGTKQ